MSLPRAIAVGLLITALGCAGKSPEEKLVKSMSSASSWIPTLQMVAEKWVGNSVPSKFARNAADAAQKEFEKAEKQVDKSKARQDLRDRLRRDLKQGKDFAQALNRAAENDEPDKIVPAISTLKPVQDDFDDIEKTYGGSS